MGRPAIGEEAKVAVEVTDDMLVDLGGRRIHPVYSTVSLIRHMEEAGRMLVERHLAPGEDATGYEVSVRHERPARVGDHLVVTGRVTRVDEREVEVAVETDGPAGRIGRGTLVQRYIEAGRFDEGGER